jgi:hypothetical protein
MPFSKTLGVLGHGEFFEPVRYLLRRGYQGGRGLSKFLAPRLQKDYTKKGRESTSPWRTVETSRERHRSYEPRHPRQAQQDRDLLKRRYETKDQKCAPHLIEWQSSRALIFPRPWSAKDCPGTWQVPTTVSAKSRANFVFRAGRGKESSLNSCGSLMIAPSSVPGCLKVNSIRALPCSFCSHTT